MREEDTPSLRFNRYRVVGRLGRGGMGEVYLAQAEGEAGFEKPVVVKTLLEELANVPGFAEDLAREAAICVRLDHEGIVQVLDFGFAHGLPYLVMEYVRGHPLSRLLRYLEGQERVLPAWATVHIGRRLLGALAYAHDVKDADGRPIGLVHRDISPSNILVAGDGRVKLADFGIARLKVEGERTAPGVLKGKYGYMGPEALERHGIDRRYDLFGVGGVLYRALTGRPPWVAADDLKIVLEVMHGGVTPVRERNPEVPEALAEVIMRALEREPGRRWEDARVMCAGLNEAIPPGGDDAERFRELVSGIFESSSFRETVGELPSIRELVSPIRQTLDRSPLRDETVTVAETGERAPRMTRRVVPAIVAIVLGLAVVATIAWVLLFRPGPAPGPLTLGLSPAAGPREARADAKRAAAYLSRATGLELHASVADDYHGLAEDLAAGRTDLAWLPPLPYVEAARSGARALVTAVREGRASYRAGLIVHRDASFRSVGELRGVRAGWVDPNSASGYVFPRRLITPYGDADTFFGAERFLGSHREVCTAVADGWVDVGATFVPACADLIGERASAVRVLAETDSIPGDTVAAGGGVSEAIRDRLTEALVGMSEEPEGQALLRDVFRCERFVRADLAAYSW